MYNTASVTLSGFPAGATPITVTRNGVNIGNAVANVGAVGGTPGAATLNVPGVVAGAGHVLDCWTTFTPDILPGDVITIGGVAGTSVIAPDFTVSSPAMAGGELVMHGKAADAAGAPMAGVVGQLFSPINRFSVGGKGGQILGGALTFDAPGSSSYTTRFLGTPGDLAIGLGATPQVTTIPPAVHPAAGAAVMTIGAQLGTPGPVPGCAAPLGSDAVTGANTKTVNIANANQALTITGSSDPNVKGVTLNLGGSVVPATLAGGTWSATMNPANLPDGTLTAAATFAAAGGSYSGRTMNIVKDTVAPGAPTADVASGSYPSARSVSLSSEPGATIRYTTNGNDPTASSRTFGDAIAVGQTQSIKAVAVDAAGNAGPVAQFDYAINPPVAALVAPKPVVVPSLAKLKVESLTLTKRTGLRSARKRGIDAIVYAPEGAKVARVRISKGAKVIETVSRKVSRDGVLEVRLPSTRKARTALKRGSYRVEIQVGQDAAHLGTKLVRIIKIV